MCSSFGDSFRVIDPGYSRQSECTGWVQKLWFKLKLLIIAFDQYYLDCSVTKSMTVKLHSTLHFYRVYCIRCRDSIRGDRKREKTGRPVVLPFVSQIKQSDSSASNTKGVLATLQASAFPKLASHIKSSRRSRASSSQRERNIIPCDFLLVRSIHGPYPDRLESNHFI